MASNCAVFAGPMPRQAVEVRRSGVEHRAQRAEALQQGVRDAEHVVSRAGPNRAPVRPVRRRSGCRGRNRAAARAACRVCRASACVQRVGRGRAVQAGAMAAAVRWSLAPAAGSTQSGRASRGQLEHGRSASGSDARRAAGRAASVAIRRRFDAGVIVHVIVLRFGGGKVLTLAAAHTTHPSRRSICGLQ